ncbi:MAG TPA: N-acetyltransferase [Pseudomonadaceae bacterium]|nr:N-acetyltransferase [Pseudomonadaceae bacterium]
MTDATPRFLHSLAEIPAADWNALVGVDYPFLRHEFLSALESTGCVSTASGWTPCHLLLEDAEGRALACMPLYQRSNSWGEYVFDWAWADAYQRHGRAYYPKLVSAIPFTPCAGPRLGIAAGLDAQALISLLLRSVQEKAQESGISGWHLLFPDEAQKTLLQDPKLLLRSGCQYQWFNRGYADFESFLAALNSRKRKNLRKERQQVASQGVHFDVLEGTQVSSEQWLQFYHFYASTYFVRGRRPYLNPEFFLQLAQIMPEQLLLVLASKGQECIAGALFFKGADTLYGRYWGCSEEFQFLHFETCYYQGIDYCIRHGYQRFDSGAQGEHKIQRGFEPVPTWSLHWIADPQFQEAIARFVAEEAGHLQDYRSHAANFLPFRQTPKA